MDTSKTSVGNGDLVWPLWLEPSFFKQGTSPSCDCTGHLPHHSLGEREDEEEWGVHFSPLLTPAAMLFPLHRSRPFTYISFRHADHFSPLFILTSPHVGSISGGAAGTRDSDRWSTVWRLAEWKLRLSTKKSRKQVTRATPPPGSQRGRDVGRWLKRCLVSKKS